MQDDNISTKALHYACLLYTSVSGTHPQYYGYSFDSGEQMNYFKPMLKDKSLKMVQDIEPNTAEHKLMQYSAMWNLSLIHI